MKAKLLERLERLGILTIEHRYQTFNGITGKAEPMRYQLRCGRLLWLSDGMILTGLRRWRLAWIEDEWKLPGGQSGRKMRPFPGWLGRLVAWTVERLSRQTEK